MTYLSEGYYYKVYDAGNGRVFKKLQPFWFSLRKIFNHNRENGKGILSSMQSACRSYKSERKALCTMKERLKNFPVSFFANPVFINRLNYTQDRVRVIEEYLKDASEERGKEIVDEYMALRVKFWEFGMHDKTYKFPTNFGIDREGKVVCIDFGEFVFNRHEAMQSILARKWLIRYGYKRWPEGPVKDYYTRRMDEVMREVILEKSWRGLS